MNTERMRVSPRAGMRARDFITEESPADVGVPPIPMLMATTGPSSRSVRTWTGRLSSTPPSTSMRGPSGRGGNIPGMLMDAITADVRSPVRCTYGDRDCRSVLTHRKIRGSSSMWIPVRRRLSARSVLRPFTRDTVGSV